MRVVLDANVFVSALIRPEGPPGQILVRFVRDGAFEVALSEEILVETRRALDYPKVRKYIRTGIDVGAWLEAIAFLAVVVEPEAPAAPVSRDPVDDKYLVTAVAAGADYIVSGDPDLLTIGVYEGIPIITPRAFLNISQA